jgi:hypothetical protein
VLQQAHNHGNVAAVKRVWTAVACLSLASCGGTVSAPSTWEPARTPAAVPASLAIASQADIELREPHVAVVRGQPVAFDGIAEGLAWPALSKALGSHKAGEVVTVQVGRNVPVQDLLRAAWTAGLVDLHVQSLDASGVMRAVKLEPHQGASPTPGCHLAVFRRPDGSLRIAAPGGPSEIAGEHAAESLARSLAEERVKCPIKYVAFGAESDADAWGPVFDVMIAVDAQKSAGDARYVLGQAMHAH